MPEKRVLIIDDDDSFAQSIKISLQANGYQVFCAGNKTEGRQMIDQCSPNLIILDVMMDKVCDGFDLAREIRGNESLKEIKILMLTAIGDEIGFKYSTGAGDDRWLSVDDYVEKSITSEELIARVNKLLGG